MRICHKIYKVYFFHGSDKILSMKVVTPKKNIPDIMSLVNTKIASVVVSLIKLGVMNAIVNHAAERFPVTAENALRKARVFSVIHIL